VSALPFEEDGKTGWKMAKVGQQKQKKKKRGKTVEIKRGRKWRREAEREGKDK